MKFTVSSTGLLSHLQILNRVISSKNTLPILDNFLFKVEGNKLTITASDLDTTLISTVELIENAENDGQIAVPSKELLNWLSVCPEQPITFTINDDNLSIKITTAQNGNITPMGKNGSEYPEIESAANSENNLTISALTLLRSISYTIFATGEDELRPVMNGIYFDIATDSLTVVASDAHKLVRFKINDVKSEKEASFILPKKPATLLKSILPKENGDVTVNFDGKNAIFALENFTMICRLVDGRYPKYNDVIPKNNPNKAIVDRMTLINALKRASVAANQASNLIKLQLNENEIIVSAQDLDYSISAQETVPCQYQSEPMSIGFKSVYLIELLSNIEQSEIVIELSDARRAGVILPLENAENEELLMLLMPIMLND